MSSKKSLWKRLIRLFTFVELPIRQKFLLFGLGTAFWLGLIALLAVGSLSFVHFRYSQISTLAFPYAKTIHVLEPIVEQIKTTPREAGEVLRENFNKIDNALVEVSLIESSDSTSENIFELFNNILAKKDAQGQLLLQGLLAHVDKAQLAIKNGNYNTSHLDQIDSMLKEFSIHTQNLKNQYTNDLNSAIRLAINAIAITGLIALFLLLFFTRWLTKAFAGPIGLITNQIEAISMGEVDLGKKMQVSSSDEIGLLSKKFNDLVDTIYGITVFKKVIEEDTSLEMVYTRLAEVFEKEAKIKECRIFDINHAKGEMRLVEPSFGGNEIMRCNPEILHDSCLCRAKKTGHNISSLEFEGVCRQFSPQDSKAHVCVPLIVGGRPSAIVQFLFDEQEMENQDDIHARLFKAKNYIKHSLSVIETKQLMHTLRESSLVDSLTGLYNRRFLQDHSNQIISGVLRRKTQIALLMCDMDYFKQVNDEHGHDVGDMLLKETSQILQNSVRESDIVVRFGGEEFLIALVDVSLGEGMRVAEKIRAKIEETKFKIPSGVLRKTISMGVSEFPTDTDGFWHAIKFADVALYRAKEDGRNRCVRFNESMWNKAESF
jgi:diguanylate cyclase (GGDEF)-like protein